MTTIKKLNEMNAISYTVKIQLGDPGGDGHGISRDRYYKTNYDRDALKAAYQKSVMKFGVDLHDVCSDYEDSSISEDIYDKLKAGGFPIENYFEDMDYIDGEFDEMVMEFIKASLPDLEYEKINMSVPSIGSFGYGLYGQ